MKSKNIFWVVLTLIILGCSNDDNPIEEPEEVTIASFRVVGEDADNVYQYDYDGDIGSGELINLTEEIGVLPSFLTLRQLDEFLSFYSFRDGAFSLAQRNYRNGASATYVDFYANGPNRSVAWGTNTLTNVFFGYFGSGDSRVLAIQDVDLQNSQSQDLTIDFNINLLFQPVLFEDKVYITYLDNEGNYKLTFYDTLGKTLGPIINFSTIPISILIDAAGDVAVVKNGITPTLEIYDSDDLLFKGANDLTFNTGFSPGPVDGAELLDNKLYYAMPFVQPARFSAGPAIFDLETQENMAIDLIGIVEEAEQEMGFTITVNTQTFSRSKNMFFVGYALLETGNQGGVLQISTEGELVNNTTFPFFPTYIIKD